MIDLKRIDEIKSAREFSKSNNWEDMPSDEAIDFLLETIDILLEAVPQDSLTIAVEQNIDEVSGTFIGVSIDSL